MSFVTGNIVSSLVSVIYSSYRTIEYNADYFSYGNLSLFKHTSYASMYVLFSTMILIYFLLNRIYSNHVWIRNIYIGTIIFFCIIIYFLASRAGYVSLFISVVFVAGYLSLRFKKRIYILIVIIVIPSVMYLFVSNPRVKYLVNLPQIVQAGNLNTTYEGVIVRYFIIRESLKIIKEHHWLGTGTGDVKDNLVERYRKSNIKFALENKLNAHNQFLETFIGLGIPGFLTLVLLLFYPLYHAVKRRNFLMISFLLIITVNFLFESMLNTQAGIIFFAFFYSLLMVNIDKTKSDI
ncbi:MAG: O-antigen ligase family protein [Bacteroidetes bacterium]|nr:O-antigen ligase family protein [Bacteroidota bacterium]